MILCSEMEHLQCLVTLLLLLGQKKYVNRSRFIKHLSNSCQRFWKKAWIFAMRHKFNRADDPHSFKYFGQELKAEDEAVSLWQRIFHLLSNWSSVWTNFRLVSDYFLNEHESLPQNNWAERYSFKAAFTSWESLIYTQVYFWLLDLSVSERTILKFPIIISNVHFPYGSAKSYLIYFKRVYICLWWM